VIFFLLNNYFSRFFFISNQPSLCPIVTFFLFVGRIGMELPIFETSVKVFTLHCFGFRPFPASVQLNTLLLVLRQYILVAPTKSKCTVSVFFPFFDIRIETALQISRDIINRHYDDIFLEWKYSLCQKIYVFCNKCLFKNLIFFIFTRYLNF
jgi:hypothetical protein